MDEFNELVKRGKTNFIHNYDDSHFHRSYHDNMTNILKKLTVGTTKMSRKMKLKREKSHWNLPEIKKGATHENHSQ